MKPLTMLENLNILKDIVASSTLYIVMIVIGLFLIMFISRTTRMNAKLKRKFYIGFYLITVVALIGIYYKDLNTMFDYMMNNLFVVLCFPNLASYLAAIIITNIILWVTTLNGKEDTATKIVNSSVFIILHYLMILLLITVHKNKLDVFSQSSIYTNDQAKALITISSVVFITWIIFTIIYKLVRKAIYNKKGMELNQVVVYTNEPVKGKIPVDFVEAPSFIRRAYTPKPAIAPTITKAEPVIIPITKKEDKKEDVIVVEKPEIKETPKEEKKVIKTKEMLAYEEALTLEDYKLLLNLLKAQKEKIKEQTRDVVISDEDRRQSMAVQSKLGELQDLYKSIS